MMPLVLAAAAAVGWGASDYLGGRSSGRTAVFSVIAITEMIGAALIAPVLVAGGVPLASARLIWAGGAGIAVTVELGVVYYALSIGAAYITAPVGALGAMFAVTAGLLGGDAITPWIGAGLGCALLGGGISANGDDSEATQHNPLWSFAACLIAALGVATTQITLHAAAKVNPYWATEIEHLTTASSAALIAAFIAIRARRTSSPSSTIRHLPARQQVPMLTLLAATGTGGDLAFAAASHGALSTVSAVSSLYPIPTIGLAFVLQRRRPHRLQTTGIIVALAGAAILGAMSP